MNSEIYTLVGCLLLPITLVIAAKQSYINAVSDEDRRYFTENWRTGINKVLQYAVMPYGITLFLIDLDPSRHSMGRFAIALALLGLVVLIICYRTMAKMKHSLTPETEYSKYEPRVKLISSVVMAIYILSTLSVMAICIHFADSIDDPILLMLAAIGMLVAICGSLAIIVDRYAIWYRDRILPASEMEMLKSKLAEADHLLNQHLPDGHIPVKLELMEFMMGFKDSLLCVSVDMKSEKRVSVSLLGLKRLDENELLFLSLSEAFRGVSNKSQIAADQRALAITADRHAAISALKKELATAFKEVRQLQKRIKALEVI